MNFIGAPQVEKMKAFLSVTWVVYRLGQTKIYGVYHYISLSQSLLDYIHEALGGLFAVAFLSGHQELLRRR
jgi:hypothetical protein